VLKNGLTVQQIVAGHDSCRGCENVEAVLGKQLRAQKLSIDYRSSGRPRLVG
jgi:hypothetical protein